MTKKKKNFFFFLDFWVVLVFPRLCKQQYRRYITKVKKSIYLLSYSINCTYVSIGLPHITVLSSIYHGRQSSSHFVVVGGSSIGKPHHCETDHDRRICRRKIEGQTTFVSPSNMKAKFLTNDGLTLTADRSPDPADDGL